MDNEPLPLLRRVVVLRGQPRKPVATYERQGHLGVTCDDGSLWEYRYGRDPGGRGWWKELPPIPGSRRAQDEDAPEELQREEARRG